MPIPSCETRQAQIAAALQAAKVGGRGRVVDALEGVEFDESADASTDEVFLQAKLAYLRNEYAKAVELFERFDRRGRGPTWQAYQSAHHRMFSLYQLGQLDASARAAAEAEGIINASSDLELLRSDILAMRGHFFEQRHDFLGAIAIFEMAHAHATSHAHAGRALTTTSDLARLYAIIGDARNGLRWSDESLRLLESVSDHKLAEAQIYNRRGMLLGMLGFRADALHALDRALTIAKNAHAAEAECDAYYLRGDQERLAGRTSEARRAYDAALETARRHGMARHEASVLRASALLALNERDTTASTARMKAGLERACGLSPPSATLLLDFARALLDAPSVLSPDGLTAAQLTRLRELAGGAEDALFRKGYDQADQARRATRAVADLQEFLRRLLHREIAVRGARVDVRHALVRFASGLEEHIDQNVVEAIQALAGSSGLTVAELADRLLTSPSAVERRLSRLRKALPGVLAKKKVADGHNRYWLRVDDPLAAP